MARAISPVAAELRMIDAGDLISLLKFEYYSSLSDLVDSAAELYFHPGTVYFGIGGDYSLDWDTYPEITLDLEIKPKGVTIYAQLMLGKDQACVNINHINFQNPSTDPNENTAFLADSLRHAAFYRTTDKPAATMTH
ncbi:hypothetical protein RRU01S_10_01080 [Agrobacterium rubi TR3 = NBRC 13261]|uniref:Uncharacterized protein n=1 Tax=Agrobacterium rubi TR3 = NBRC 13261 TaxID=1368415 RepID=A0A081CUC3_9HYPH|nr:hypothetical protein [Agrobacterium rubi]GAK70269.1 hypothetical protein RRU01S_10_01080 [Agrobacterium rubi TR3 = NBRC 13261]